MEHGSDYTVTSSENTARCDPSTSQGRVGNGPDLIAHGKQTGQRLEQDGVPFTPHFTDKKQHRD